jgi:hypothetical protein
MALTEPIYKMFPNTICDDCVYKDKECNEKEVVFWCRLHKTYYRLSRFVRMAHERNRFPN